MTSSLLRLCSASAAVTVLLAVQPAMAYDDLIWPVADDLGFTLYGQINQSYLNYNDGFDQRGFFTVDNSTNYNGSFVGMRGFGASGAADELYRHFGITAEAIAAEARRLLADGSGGSGCV